MTLPRDILAKSALAWYDAGCSIWPPMQDGTKRPMGEWKRFMIERPPRDLIKEFYTRHEYQGVGIICGRISGNLEMLELEGRATDSEKLAAVERECEARGVLGLWHELLNDGYAEWTPSAGIHFVYRIADHPVPGNTKVARRLATPEELAENPDHKIKTLSETRGEGGYVIVAPSYGEVHPTGDSWNTFAGRIGAIPTIDWDRRSRLLEAIHAAIDEMPPEAEYVRPAAPRLAPMDATRPGDDFMMRTSWEEILEPLGWRVHHHTLKETFWTRPGKKRKDGWSATTGFAGSGLDDRLYVWSSSTEFDTEKPYTKFGAYAKLHHHGDFSAAARELGSRGYGDQRPRRPDISMPLAAETPASNALAVQDTEVQVAAAAEKSPVQRTSLGLPVITRNSMDGMIWDGIGVADHWVQMHQDIFRHKGADKKWQVWNGKTWEADSHLRHEHAMKEFVVAMRNNAQTPGEVKIANRLTSATNISALVRNARSRPEIAVVDEEFDSHQNLMTVDNGILDIESMSLLPHDPKYMLTRKMNASFKPDAPKGRWDRFMEEVLPDPAVRGYLQRVAGYMLTGTVRERVMVLLYGESGTGKTQFLEAIGAVMGDFGGVVPSSAFKPRRDDHRGPSEDLHRLRGTRFVMQSELDANSRLNEALVKSIVGADTVSTRPLYGSFVDWRPEFTTFMATNHLPRISSSENAIWNRVKPINFGEIFINEKGQALHPDDRGIGRRMAEEEPEVILNWMLEGLREYRRIGLDEPEQIGTWLNTYREEVDTARQFLKQAPEDGFIEIAPGAKETVREVYRAYVSWCQDNGITPLGTRNFSLRLEAAGFTKKRESPGIMWQGIGKVRGDWLAAGSAALATNWSKRE